MMKFLGILSSLVVLAGNVLAASRTSSAGGTACFTFDCMPGGGSIGGEGCTGSSTGVVWFKTVPAAAVLAGGCSCAWDGGSEAPYPPNSDGAPQAVPVAGCDASVREGRSPANRSSKSSAADLPNTRRSFRAQTGSVPCCVSQRMSRNLHHVGCLHGQDQDPSFSLIHTHF